MWYKTYGSEKNELATHLVPHLTLTHLTYVAKLKGINCDTWFRGVVGSIKFIVIGLAETILWTHSICHKMNKQSAKGVTIKTSRLSSIGFCVQPHINGHLDLNQLIFIWNNVRLTFGKHVIFVYTISIYSIPTKTSHLHKERQNSKTKTIQKLLLMLQQWPERVCTKGYNAKWSVLT